MVLGLVRPTSGQALIGGVSYQRLAQPRRQVGALLEATSFHPGRRARDHLRVRSTAHLLPQWGGGVVLLGYAAAFAVAAVLTTLNRDVT